ncbi:MAG: protein-glutamate O-methyltransferase CheR [Sphingobacteriales bacterium]|nr:MAG: protein-glutamate O-methyltransferase CheR [Sphingobacteriales bacterium]
MYQENLERNQLDALIILINDIYGYDFSGYSHASLQRRFDKFYKSVNVPYPQFREKLSSSPEFFNRFLRAITVNVTEMFRDPYFFRELALSILPRISSYPIIKIWHAGCATGEEAYSMAILLEEAGLLERSRIYATDLNPMNLEKAEKGIVPLQQMQAFTQNYLASGGRNDFSDYYTARYDNAIIKYELRKHITFSQHNLVTDQVFNEFQLICCRNVLIYFNRELQNRVIKLFYDSLAPLGYLALGSKESLLFTDTRDKFEVKSQTNKIFRRKT